MNNLDINDLLGLLGKVNKQDLEKAIYQANQIMNSDKKDAIVNELKDKMK